MQRNESTANSKKEMKISNVVFVVVISLPLPLQNPEMKLVREYISVISTAYSSTRRQCDSTPFITATGERVKDGGVAVNRSLEKKLPMGTRFAMNGKEYIVNDRMSRRWTKDRVDIWMRTEKEARDYGKQKITIVIWKMVRNE